jgi:hypothetical protein
MVFENGVKNIQATAYNGASTVAGIKISFEHVDSWEKIAY